MARKKKETVNVDVFHVDQTYRILGLDPGSKHFAWSVIEVTPVMIKGNHTVRVDIVKTGILEFSLKSTRNIGQALFAFLMEIDIIINDVIKPCQAISFEQFQSRGVGTSLLEIVNMMLGALIIHFKHLEVVHMTPATWKTAVKKIFDLDDEYRYITCTPHELDASLIGAYGVFKLMNIKPAFNGYKPSHFYGLAREVEEVSTTEVRKRKVSR